MNRSILGRRARALHRAAVAVLALIALTPGCGSPKDNSPKGNNDGVRTKESVELLVEWKLLGSPQAAIKIAACAYDSRLYALNYDGSIWVNHSGGKDGGWKYVITDTYVQQLFCGGNQLWVLNSDRSLWRNDGSDTAVNWTYVGTPSYAKQITGSTSFAFGPYAILYALNDDNSLWSSTTGKDGDWRYVGRPTAAVRIAAGGGGLEARPFGINGDGTLWLNAGDGCDRYWHEVSEDPVWLDIGSPFDLRGAEIAAGNMYELYVLRADHKLWKGTIANSDNLTSRRSDGKAQHCEGNVLVTNHCGNDTETPCGGNTCNDDNEEPAQKVDGTVVCAPKCGTVAGAPCCRNGTGSLCDRYAWVYCSSFQSPWVNGVCYPSSPQPQPPPPPPPPPGAGADPSWCGQVGQVCCHHKKACESDAKGSFCKQENDGNYYCTYPPAQGSAPACPGGAMPKQVSYCAECPSNVNYALFGQFCSSDDAKKLATALYPGCTIADGGSQSVCP